MGASPRKTDASPAGRRGRGRPAIPAEVQRKRLVDATLRVLEKSHYGKVTVADIVREAGSSTRSFYVHFDSKEDVLAEIVRLQASRFVARIEEIFRQRGSDEEIAGRAVRAYLELFPAGTVDLERLGGEAGQRVRDMRRRYVQALTDLVLQQYERIQAAGRIARVPDRAAVELAITGIEGLSFRYYSEGRRDELLALQPVLQQAFLRALAPPGR